MVDWLEKRTVYEGGVLAVRAGRVRVAGDQVVEFDLVEHDGGVGVVALLEGDVLLVRQTRPAVDEALLEIPAGKLEGGADDPEARARAELEEETGYRAGRLVRAVEFFVSPGYTTERIVVYLAFDLTHVGARPEATEDIELVRLSLAEVRRMLAEGRFRDGKTIIGLRELLARLDSQE